jgi:hypothetical protein
MFRVLYRTVVEDVCMVRLDLLPFAPSKKIEISIDGECRTPESIVWDEREQLFEVYLEAPSVTDLTTRGWSVWQPVRKEKSGHPGVEAHAVHELRCLFSSLECAETILLGAMSALRQQGAEIEKTLALVSQHYNSLTAQTSMLHTLAGVVEVQA